MNDQRIGDHEFEPYQLGNLVICIHLDGTQPCGRSKEEHEHVPAEEVAEA